MSDSGSTNGTSQPLSLLHEIDAAATSGVIFTGAAILYYAIPHIWSIDIFQPALFLLVMISLSAFMMTALNVVFDQRKEAFVYLSNWPARRTVGSLLLGIAVFGVVASQVPFSQPYAFGAVVSLLTVVGVVVGIGKWWADVRFPNVF